MRGLRSTIALVVVLAGLFGYIYFVTWKQPGSDTIIGKERLFTSLDSEKIEELTVKSESGETTSIRKDSGTWQVTAPVAAKADETEISSITSNLTTLEIQRVVDENPTDLKEYGLATPRVVVEFRSAGDKEPRKLLIGEKSPTGGDLFVKRDDNKRVVLVSGYTDSIFNRTTFDLRDKRLLAFERDMVDGLEVTSEGKTLELAKEGSDWKIVKPVALRADFGSVEGLIGRVQTSVMKSIVSDTVPPEELKKYGLDKPQGSLSIKAGSARATLLVGAKTDQSAVYARDASRMSVVTIDSSILEELKKGADAYRRKALFDFRAYNTDRLEFTREGQTIVFEKAKGQDPALPDKWRRVSPNPGEPNQTNMESVIAKLENMRASTFVNSAAGTGLDKPTLAVLARLDDGKTEERVPFSKTGNDVYSVQPGTPGAVKVDTGSFDDLITALDLVAK